MRASTAGASTDVGTTATSVGVFTTLLLDINPTYTHTGYPNVWTQFTVTMSGVADADHRTLRTPLLRRERRADRCQLRLHRHRHRLRPVGDATTSATTAASTATSAASATTTATSATATTTSATATTATTSPPRHRHLRHHHRLRHLRPASAATSGPTAGPLSRAERDRPAAGNGEGPDPGPALPSRSSRPGSLPARRPCRRPEPTGRLGTASRLQGQPAGGPALTTQ